MSLVDEVAKGATGLQQLQALIDQKRMPGIAESLQFQLTEVELGRAVFEAEPGHHAYNPIGVIHGGYIATLLDSAAGCAVHSMLDETQAYTTLELKVSYERAIRADSGRIRAIGTISTMGRKAAFAEAKLFDGDGRVLASATTTCLVFPRPS